MITALQYCSFSWWIQHHWVLHS